MSQYLIIGQYAILAIFILFHTLLGLKRGFKKTTYFFVAHVITVIALFILLRHFTIALFIKPESILPFVSKYIDLPLEIKEFLSDPQTLMLAVALLDLVLKLILFIVGYYILRGFIVLFVFGIIWQIIKPKKINGVKKPVNRIAGLFMGSFRGLFSGIVYIYPILILVSIFSIIEIPNNNQVNVSTNSNQTTTINIPEEYLEIFNDIRTFNESSVLNLLNKVKIKKQGFGDYAIDYALSTTIDKTDQSITLTKELRGLFTVLQGAIEIGLLDNSFDAKTFDKEELAKIKPLFEYISSSDLINAGYEYGLEYFLTDFLNKQGIGLEDQEVIFKKLDNANLIEDFMQFYEVAEALLEIGSLERLQVLAENPKLLLELTEEEQTKFISLINKTSDLDVFKISSAGLLIGIHQESILNKITWLDTKEERLDYLKENLGIIINDDEYLGKQIANLSKIIEVVYDFEHESDITIIDFFTKPNIANLLTGVDQSWVEKFSTALIDQLNVVFDVSPLILDYLENTQENIYIKDFITIVNESENIKLKEEVSYIFNVYQGILDIGFNSEDLEGTLKPLLLLDFMGNNQSLKPFFEEYLFESELIQTYADKTIANLLKSIVKDPSLYDRLSIAEKIISEDDNKRQLDEVQALINFIQSLYDKNTDINPEDSNYFKLDGMNMENIQSKLLTFDTLAINNLVSDSIYVHMFIDKVLQDLDQTSEQFLIPLEAKTDITINDDTINVVKVEEIQNAISAIKALGITSLNGFDINSIKFQTIKDAISKDSLIINHTIWENVDKILLDQFNVSISSTNKTKDLVDLMDALIKSTENHSNPVENIGGFTTSSIESMSIQDIKNARSSNSLILDEIIIKKITEIFNQEPYQLNIKDDLFKQENNDEIDNLLNAIQSLGINSLSNVDISTDNLNINSIEMAFLENSVILNRLLAQQLYQNLNNTLEIPNEVLVEIDETNGPLKPEVTQEELHSLIQAIKALTGENQSISDINFDMNTLSIENIKEAIETNSMIILRNISKEILKINSLRIPESIHDGKYILKAEIIGMLEGLLAADINNINELTNLTGNIYDHYGISQIKAMIFDEASIYRSRILAYSITDSVENIFNNNPSIPEKAFETIENEKYLKAQELLTLLTTMQEINGSDSFEIDTENMTSINHQLLTSMLNKESYLLNRLISKAVISANLATEESFSDTIYDIQVEELYNLIDTLEFLEIDSINDFSNIQIFELFVKVQNDTSDQLRKIIDVDNEGLSDGSIGLGHTIIHEFIVSLDTSGFIFQQTDKLSVYTKLKEGY